LTPISRLVVDSWAWVEYFDGSKAGKRVEAALRSAEEVWTSAVSIAEIVSRYQRKGIDESPALETLTSISRIGEPTLDDAREVGMIHARTRKTSPNFGIGDSFVLQLARKTGARVLTGDPDFKGIKEAEFLD
jgi:predicted nucleic acid-binding protein